MGKLKHQHLSKAKRRFCSTWAWRCLRGSSLGKRCNFPPSCAKSDFRARVNQQSTGIGNCPNQYVSGVRWWQSLKAWGCYWVGGRTCTWLKGSLFGIFDHLTRFMQNANANHRSILRCQLLINLLQTSRTCKTLRKLSRISLLPDFYRNRLRWESQSD